MKLFSQKLMASFVIAIICALGCVNPQSASAKTVLKFVFQPKIEGITMSYDGGYIRGNVRASTGDKRVGTCELRIDGVVIQQMTAPPFEFLLRTDREQQPYVDPKWNKRLRGQELAKSVKLDDGLQHTIEAYVTTRDVKGKEDWNWGIAGSANFSLTEEEPQARTSLSGIGGFSAMLGSMMNRPASQPTYPYPPATPTPQPIGCLTVHGQTGVLTLEYALDPAAGPIGQQSFQVKEGTIIRGIDNNLFVRVKCFSPTDPKGKAWDVGNWISLAEKAQREVTL